MKRSLLRTLRPVAGSLILGLFVASCFCSKRRAPSHSETLSPERRGPAAVALPTTALIRWTIEAGEPVGYVYTAELRRKGNQITLSRTITRPRKKATTERYPVSLKTFRAVWELVVRGKLQTFKPVTSKGLRMVDYGVRQLRIEWTDASGSRVNAQSWGRRIANGAPVSELSKHFRELLLKHEQPRVRPDLTHVRVGQQYWFKVTEAGKPDRMRVLTVLAVHAASVRYREVTLERNGTAYKTVVPPAVRYWEFSPMDRTLKLRAGKSITLGGQVLQSQVHAIGVGNYHQEVWFTYRQGRPTFPEAVKSIATTNQRSKVSRLVKITSPAKP